MTSRLAALPSEELQARLEGRPAPVGILVLGATEAHGPHLPLDTDTVIGVHLAERLAEEIEETSQAQALLAPPFTATAATCAEGFGGTVSVPREVERDALAATIRELLAAGLTRLCLLTVHFDPDHLAAVEDALAALSTEERQAVLYPDLTTRARAERVGGEFATGDCHAGAFETSLVLAAAPERVDDVHRELPENRVGLVEAIREGKRSFEEIGMPRAYCGAPAEASAERGRELYDTLTEILLEACRDEWKLSPTTRRD